MATKHKPMKLTHDTPLTADWYTIGQSALLCGCEKAAIREKVRRRNGDGVEIEYRENPIRPGTRYALLSRDTVARFRKETREWKARLNAGSDS